MMKKEIQKTASARKEYEDRTNSLLTFLYSDQNSVTMSTDFTKKCFPEKKEKIVTPS